MVTEERVKVAIINGTEEEIEKLKAEQGFTVDKEACVAVPEVEEIRPEDVLKVGYYKERIESLKREKAALIKERDELAKIKAEHHVLIERQRIRINKLEQAFIEAAIK